MPLILEKFTPALSSKGTVWHYLYPRAKYLFIASTTWVREVNDRDPIIGPRPMTDLMPNLGQRLSLMTLLDPYSLALS